MGRHKKIDMAQEAALAMALFGTGASENHKNYDLLGVFSRGLQAGMEIGRAQERENQRKREAAENG